MNRQLRLAQLQIDDFCPPPILLMGDLNSKPDTSVYRYLINGFLPADCDFSKIKMINHELKLYSVQQCFG